MKRLFGFIALAAIVLLLSLTACGGWKSYDGKSESEVMKIAYQTGNQWAQVSGVEGLDAMVEGFKSQCFGATMSEEDNKVFMRCRDEAIRGVADAVLEVWQITDNSIAGNEINMTVDEAAEAYGEYYRKAQAKYDRNIVSDPSVFSETVRYELEIGRSHIESGSSSIEINVRFDTDIETSDHLDSAKSKVIESQFRIFHREGKSDWVDILSKSIYESVKSLGKVEKEFDKMTDGLCSIAIIRVKGGYYICFYKTKKRSTSVTVMLTDLETLKALLAEIGETMP